jgi:hypothetical protein
VRPAWSPRWAPWVMRWTTPWPRASSPPWSASCSTVRPGPPEPGCARRCSTSSRSSTTVNAATPPSATSHPSATSSSTHHQHLPHSQRVHDRQRGNSSLPRGVPPSLHGVLLLRLGIRAHTRPIKLKGSGQHSCGPSGRAMPVPRHPDHSHRSRSELSGSYDGGHLRGITSTSQAA